MVSSLMTHSPSREPTDASAPVALSARGLTILGGSTLYHVVPHHT